MLANRPVHELVDEAMVFYRRKEWQAAIGLFQEALDREPQHWRAKLYMGMSLYYKGDLLMANGQFRALTMTCTDPEIKKKAEMAMAAMRSQIQAMPEMTCTIKRPQVTQPAAKQPEKPEVDDGSDVEWVPQEMREHHT